MNGNYHYGTHNNAHSLLCMGLVRLVSRNCLVRECVCVCLSTFKGINNKSREIHS